MENSETKLKWAYRRGAHTAQTSGGDREKTHFVSKAVLGAPTSYRRGAEAGHERVISLM